jgi:hypothetical protein
MIMFGHSQADMCGQTDMAELIRAFSQLSVVNIPKENEGVVTQRFRICNFTEESDGIQFPNC